MLLSSSDKRYLDLINPTHCRREKWLFLTNWWHLFCIQVKQVSEYLHRHQRWSQDSSFKVWTSQRALHTMRPIHKYPIVSRGSVFSKFRSTCPEISQLLTELPLQKTQSRNFCSQFSHSEHLGRNRRKQRASRSWETLSVVFSPGST